MKRTAEITCTSIGLVLNLFGAIGFLLLTTFFQTDDFKYGFEEGFNEGLAEEGYEGAMEAGTFISAIIGFGWFLSILCIISIILGIIAIYFFVGNKKPKAASIILIITSVVLVIGTMGLGFLAFLCYLVAGIVGLVRKPPVTNNEETMIVSDN